MDKAIERGAAQLDSLLRKPVRTVKLRCGAEITPQPITWLWHEWLPAGKLTILAGAAGTGENYSCIKPSCRIDRQWALA